MQHHKIYKLDYEESIQQPEFLDGGNSLLIDKGTSKIDLFLR